MGRTASHLVRRLNLFEMPYRTSTSIVFEPSNFCDRYCRQLSGGFFVDRWILDTCIIIKAVEDCKSISTASPSEINFFGMFVDDTYRLYATLNWRDHCPRTLWGDFPGDRQTPDTWFQWQIVSWHQLNYSLL